MVFKISRIRNLNTEVYEIERSEDFKFENGKLQPVEFIPDILFYRYIDNGFDVSFIELNIYRVLRETKCGYWYLDFDKERWVSKTGERKYCHPNKEDAWEHFKARKIAHIRHVKNKLAHLENILSLIEEKEKEKEKEKFK